MRLKASLFGLLTSATGLAVGQPPVDDGAPTLTTASSTTIPTTPGADPTKAPATTNAEKTNVDITPKTSSPPATSTSPAVFVPTPFPSEGLFQFNPATPSNPTISYTNAGTVAGLTVTAASLHDNDNNVIASVTISNSNSPTSGAGKESEDSDEEAVGRRQAAVPLLRGVGNSVIIPFDGQVELTQHYGAVLYLEFAWEGEDEKGSSFSPPLAVWSDETQRAAASTALKWAHDTLGSTGPYRTDNITPSSPSSTGSNVVPTSSIPSATPVDEVSTGHGHGGLTNGAIAGIAVGVGSFVILLIAFLVWFFVLRKRRNGGGKGGSDAVVGGYGNSSDVGTHHAMIAGKEFAGVTETNSPHHSTYAVGGVVAPEPHHHHQHHDSSGDGYAPYTDRVATPPSATSAHAPAHSTTDLTRGGGGGGGGADGTATPPAGGINSRYAHLVEEGMTEDEIRRLEEEERVLDAAIEESGRGSNRGTPTRG
ncbi:hypothetical protein F4780DRAFT_524089 [Xylariomycetidae sp. FL0641]|nr:hypothetical protein F4780DRAFT_524089 [Xylariomycetidae sp. FL0641]